LLARFVALRDAHVFPHRIAKTQKRISAQVLCEEHALCARTGADASALLATRMDAADDAGAAALRCAALGRGVCFAERPCGRFSARAALADLDAAPHAPAAFAAARLLPAPWAACSGVSGGKGSSGSGSGGSGGVWARGALTDGAPVAAAASDALRRLLEACDAPCAAHLLFAADGGTGGGLGASMLQRLEDEHPSLLRVASIVAPSSFSFAFPSAASPSFAAAAPLPPPPPTAAYNAALTLAALAASGAHTQLLHNASLAASLRASASASAPFAPFGDSESSSNEGVFDGASGVGGLNALAAAALAGASAYARLRWDDARSCGGGGGRDLQALTAALVPFPRLHLLTPALAPAAWHAQAAVARCCAAARRRGVNNAGAGAPAEAASSASASASASATSAASPPLRGRRVFPLEASLLSEALCRSPSASETHPHHAHHHRTTTTLAASVTLCGAALSPAAAADAAHALSLAAPSTGPPWGAAAGAAAAANAASLCFAPPLVAWHDASRAPPGGASACALLNTTAAAAALAAAAAAFAAPFRRRARVHLYTAEGMSDDDLADAAQAVTGAFLC
jgi:hypothetical protein